MTTSPAVNPVGHVVLPGGPGGPGSPCGPGGPVGPVGPVATLMVTVRGGACPALPRACDVRNPAPPASVRLAAISATFALGTSPRIDKRSYPQARGESVAKLPDPLVALVLIMA